MAQGALHQLPESSCPQSALEYGLVKADLASLHSFTGLKEWMEQESRSTGRACSFLLVHSCNPRIWEVEAREWEIQGHSQPHSQPPHLLASSQSFFDSYLGSAWKG